MEPQVFYGFHCRDELTSRDLHLLRTTLHNLVFYPVYCESQATHHDKAVSPRWVDIAGHVNDMMRRPRFGPAIAWVRLNGHFKNTYKDL